MKGMIASVISTLTMAQHALSQTLPPVTFQRNPKATFLLHPSNNVAMPQIIELASINAETGDCLEFAISGNFQCQMPSNPACVSNGTGIIFSADSIVLPNTQLMRVPGAIDAGLSIVTQPTCGPNGVAPTDIPHDFRADVTPLVTVPAGAAFMIVGTPDCYVGDNLDSDNNFQLHVTVIKHVECPGDIAPLICRDNQVDVDDLLAVINAWGPCEKGGCAADLAPQGGNGSVDVDDLLIVINNWGSCR